MDVPIRCGTKPVLTRFRKAVLEIKAHFEEILGCSIYKFLPGALENSL